MKRMICYFLLCALVLVCIAGCISGQPGQTTEPSGSASLQGTQNSQPQGTLDPGFTVPTYDLETLPTVDREPIGTVGGTDPEQEIYILTGKNHITYAAKWANNNYGFYIYSKKPLNTSSISVTVPVSYGYSVKVREVELNGISEVGITNRMNEQFYSDSEFSYPLYLAYIGKDFRKLAELENKRKQLRELTYQYEQMMLDGEITGAEYNLLMQPFWDAVQEHEAYLNAEWEDYLALTKKDLPQFYVYYVGIYFSYGELKAEESFTEIEVTIGDQVYVQDIGKISLIRDWELPAPLDWTNADNATDGIMGGANSPAVYCDGVHYIDTYFHFEADTYKLLQKVEMLDPTQQVDRVWLLIRPKEGARFVQEWDMSEPYEVYPGDDVTVYVTYRDESLKNPGYQTMTDAYLLYSTDGESYCKFSHSQISIRPQHYLWYAILFDGIDVESYYWDYYYQFYEPWRMDPEEDPAWWD